MFWGDPVLQGLHIGIFIALLAVLVFWFLLNRSTTGFEVRAVGFNPEAARYSGMSVAKNYILVMAVCGVFAGLAGGIDVLGWQFRIATNDIQKLQLGFFGIAVALLGPEHGDRDGRRRRSCSARCSAARRSATSTRPCSSRRWPRTSPTSSRAWSS